MPRLTAAFWVIGLAAAIHLDWHAARPVAHAHSLGLGWHWLFAVPVFALLAWYVHRAWPRRAWRASAIVIGVAGFLAAVVEPAWELWVGGAPREWAFGRPRLIAFATFLAAGVVTHVTLLTLVMRRRSSGPTPD